MRDTIIWTDERSRFIPRLIFQVDVNSAYLSWEAARRVSLGEEDIRLIPAAIGVALTDLTR